MNQFIEEDLISHDVKSFDISLIFGPFLDTISLPCILEILLK